MRTAFLVVATGALLSTSALATPVDDRFDPSTTIRIEGRITAITMPAPGLACLELWVASGGAEQRWAVECGKDSRDLLTTVKPGDQVVVNGHPERRAGTQRLLLSSLSRASESPGEESAGR